MADKTFRVITKEEYRQFFCHIRRTSQNCTEKKGCYLSLWNHITQEKNSADADNGLSPLKVALDIRKFEIELYWKRTTFFWAFLVAIYTAYFYICKNCGDNSAYLILLSFLASCFSFLWYLSNRGSKFWQENWEAHVSALEDHEIGPLFKIIKRNNNKFRNILSAYDYSVSKANIIASVLICLSSVGLCFYNVLFICNKPALDNLQNVFNGIFGMIVLIIAFIAFLIVIEIFSRGFASKPNLENTDDSGFVTGSDSYKNLKESK